MVTTTAVDMQQSERSNDLPDEPSNGYSDDASASEDGDPPDPVHRHVDMAPCSVWFGPVASPSVERDLLAQLGSRRGVAVLQWPRDVDRATRLTELGIPCLWFFRCPDGPPFVVDELQEWLPSTASDQEVHESLLRLSERAAIQRSMAHLELDEDCLHLGPSMIELAPDDHDLPALVLEHFEQSVDDRVLAHASKHVEQREASLFGDLFRLDRSLNQIGLEIIPASKRAHLLRRCRS